MPESLFPSSGDRGALLREAVHLLVGELALLVDERWEDLPELKRRKVVLAARLRQVNWEAVAHESWPTREVLNLISQLESHSHDKARGVIELADRKIIALQELNLHCRECDSVSLRKNARV